jgi:hypothetical protein
MKLELFMLFCLRTLQLINQENKEQSSILQYKQYKDSRSGKLKKRYIIYLLEKYIVVNKAMQYKYGLWRNIYYSKY